MSRLPWSEISAVVFALSLGACSGEVGDTGATGAEGEAGPSGTNGDDGTPGTAGGDGADGATGADGADGVNGVDARVADPADTFMSFAVTNNSGGTHRGVNVVTLDFDGDAPDGSTVVCTRPAAPPRLDGVDGTDEWGALESDLTFDVGSGNNGIAGATLRCLYDDEYIYFFAQWTETTGDGATIGKSAARKTYTYDGAAWTRTANEDRAFFAFPIDDDGFAAGGCVSACHGGTMAAPTDKVWDVWHWKAARNGPAFTADDKWWDDGTYAGTPNNGRNSDYGMSSYWEPGASDMPAYMPATAMPGGGALAGPVWVWDAVPFDGALAWAADDGFPGLYNRLPTGSRADVAAVARWDDIDTWTLEMRRARWTGNGDDVQF